jgi:hypothetical protein
MHTDTSKRLHLTPFNPWVPGPYVPLVANTTNQSGITADELQTAVVRALRMWQTASFDAFSFDYWQGSDPEIYEVGMKRDGLSSLFFASADPQRGGLGPSQSAYTRVYFDAETGAIDEVDIVLNDVDMSFTTDQAMANYTGGGERHVIVLQDVIAHELGHVLGLGHSGVLDATMFAFGWDGQGDLSCDDVRAVRSLYGTGDERGALTGRILDPQGEPVMAAHVVAIELEGPSIAASAISGGDGTYKIASLPRGSYVVMAEPFVAGADALDDIYAGMSLTRNCEGQRFSRSFYGSANGRLDVKRLSAGATSNAGDLTVSCTGVAPALGLQDMEPPRLEFDADGVLAALLLATPNSPQQVMLRTHDGPLELDFLSYSLFSPARVLPTLDDPDGSTVTADLASAPPSAGARSQDSRLRVAWVGAGEHAISLDTSLLEPTTYPMGLTYLDEEPFVLVLGRQSTQGSPKECWSSVPARDYTPPSDGPRRLHLDDDGPFGISCRVAAAGYDPTAGRGWFVLSALLALVACGRGWRHVSRRGRARRSAPGRNAG